MADRDPALNAPSGHHRLRQAGATRAAAKMITGTFSQVEVPVNYELRRGWGALRSGNLLLA